MSATASMRVTIQKAQRQLIDWTIKAANRGPTKGERMSAVDQMLILRGCSWKKYMSLMNIRPPPAATTEKNPLRMRAAMKLLKLVAAEHQAAVPNEIHWKNSRTGRRPK